MNCFYHSTTAAVGICKSCGKGLCPLCAADLGKGLACKGRCEEDVRGFIHMSNYSIAMVDSRKGNMRGSTLTGGIFNIAIGLIFITPVIFIHDGVMLFLALPLGLVVFTMGILAIRRARTLPK
jgi:VIT1/CCC1 family predicted Fe2+/Mn2+ transporter